MKKQLLTCLLLCLLTGIAISARSGNYFSNSTSAALNNSVKPVITLGTLPEICFNVVSFTIPYTVSAGAPVTYSISGTNIVPVTDAVLSPSEITVNVTGNLYGSVDFLLIVKDANGYFSDNITGTVVVKNRPEMEIKVSLPDCTTDGALIVPIKKGLVSVSYSFGGTAYGIGGSTPTPFTTPATVATEVIPKGNQPYTTLIRGREITYMYISMQADYLNCISNSFITAVLESVTNCCPVLPTITMPSAPVCSNSTFSISTTDMLNMESFDAAGTDYGVKFVYFNAPTTDPYTGGTLLGTVGFDNLTNAKKTAVLSDITLPAGTYYVYAVLSSLPRDTGCRPSVSGVLTVDPSPTLTLGTIPAICANASSFAFPYTSTTNFPFTYSITGTSGTAINNVTDRPLASAPDLITVQLNPPISGTSVAFTLTVKDANGCTSQNIPASAVVTPLPTATISGTTAICRNAPSPFITFTGNNGTAPYTFTYQVNGGSNRTISTNGDNSITVPQSTATEGVVTYSLVSVKDASSNQCSQAQTGSATVSIIGKPAIALFTLGQTLVENNTQTFCDTDSNPTNTLAFNSTTTCVTGSLMWRTQIGAGAWSDWSVTTPKSQPSDNRTYRYQAACDPNCSLTYTGPIAVTINYRASVPQNVSLGADGTTIATGESKIICDAPGNTLTFSATCAVGEILLYSVDGGDYITAVPSQIVDNNFHNYRVRCRKADGTAPCLEAESDVMSLKITTLGSAPTVSISPLSGCEKPTAFTGTSTCGTLNTIWFNAVTDGALPSLPVITPNVTTSYYVRCQNEAGCLSEKSNTVTYTLTPVNDPPTVTASGEIVCTGTEVTLRANCPPGANVLWNATLTQNPLKVAFNSISRQTYTARCVFANGCQSPTSTPRTIFWKAFELTLINIGQSQSGSKPGNDRNLWNSQFITADGGPILENSTQSNPTIYHSEKINKTAPRYWTIQVETCALGTDGSVTYDLLAAPEVGVPQSFNTHENNAPYLMYANREGWTELYAQNHPAYGFYHDNGSGGNTYDAGLPKGLYKLGIRYWDQKGQGSIYPSTRQPAGNVLAYQEYWFRIQSQNGIGTGASRISAESMEEGFAQVSPNPISHTLRLKISEARGQKVSAGLMDASGRTLLQRAFLPQTDQHQEEFEISHLANGMYFLQVKTADKQTTIKVIKVE